jgi:hypothetical protein
MIQRQPSKRKASQDRASDRQPGKTLAKAPPGHASSNDPVASLDGWERFWFAPQGYPSLRWMRVSLGLLAFMYVVSFIISMDVWFGASGLLSASRLGQVIVSNDLAEAARWRWSILYPIESVWLLRVVLGCVAVCAVGVILGRGGRIAALVLWLGVLSLANASWVVAAVGLIPLSIGLGILVVSGLGHGTSRQTVLTSDAGSDSKAESVPVCDSWQGLGIRLAQTHLVFFLAAYSLSQWMNTNDFGSGFQRQMLVLGMDTLASYPAVCRTLQGILIGIPLIAIPMLVWVPSQRNMVSLVLSANLLLVGLISGDMLYAGSLIAMTTVFVTGQPFAKRLAKQSAEAGPGVMGLRARGI